MSLQQVLVAGGGVVGTSYPTLNPADKGSTVVLSASDRAMTSSGFGGVRGTKQIPAASDKYWEVTANTTPLHVGIAKATADLENYPGNSADAWVYIDAGYTDTGGVLVAGNATYASGDVIGVRYNSSTGALTFYKNNVLQAHGFTGLSGTMFPIVGGYACGAAINFGPTTVYAPPGAATLLTN